jgi:hypothetical protein
MRWIPPRPLLRQEEWKRPGPFSILRRTKLTICLSSPRKVWKG